MSFVGSVIDLSLIGGMFWATWRICCVFIDEWIAWRPIYRHIYIGGDVSDNSEWVCKHVWDDCICGCDPDWHYLNFHAVLCCGNCKEGETK